MKWIRKQVGWIAGLAVGCFVIWLSATVVSLQATRADTVGVLFGKRVPLQSYLKAVEAVSHQALLTYGDQYRQKLSEQNLERQAWERVILLIEAKRKKIRVLDQEVVAELQKWPLFQTEGRFDPRGYATLIQYNLQTTPRAFEEEVRENLMIRKLFDQALGNITLTDEELKVSFREKEGAIKVSYIRTDEESVARGVAQEVRKSPREFEKIVKKWDLTVTTSDFFKRSSVIPELGAAQTVLEPAFSLEPGEVAGPLKTAQGWLLVRLEDKQPADEEKFYSGLEELRKELLSQKRLKVSVTWYQDLLKRANLKELPLITHLRQTGPKKTAE